MCKNAMTYNRPETIYYKEAKRLLQSGIKLLSMVNQWKTLVTQTIYATNYTLQAG